VGGRGGLDEVVEESGELWHVSTVRERSFDFEEIPQPTITKSSTVQRISSTVRRFPLTMRGSFTWVNSCPNRLGFGSLSNN
ncbi:hypothetical protein, partial [Gordonia terrae]|uniref:hypothetical protein n=1 Tax=Gordonia terrae TaxID=2055 RepID=UPI001C606F4A